MKDNFFGFAHYAPGYLYDVALLINPSKDVCSHWYSDRLEEYEEYYGFHCPEAYRAEQLDRDGMRQYYGIDTTNSAFPNFPISEYDSAYRHEEET